jgi:hypothetical protein
MDKFEIGDYVIYGNKTNDILLKFNPGGSIILVTYLISIYMD